MRATIILLLCAATWYRSLAFTATKSYSLGNSQHLRQPRTLGIENKFPTYQIPQTTQIYESAVREVSNPTVTRSFNPFKFLAQLSRGVRISIIRVTAFFLAFNFSRLLWPGIQADKSKTEPLPPGSMGCPFIGNVSFLFASKKYGSGHFYYKFSKLIGNLRVWRYYFLGSPVAVVSAGPLKEILLKGFKDITAGGVERLEGGLMPMDSLLFESNKKRHSFLRRLVGSALTPEVVAKAVPTLVTAADAQVDRILSASQSTVKMEEVCRDYALDVAWRHILGLDLKEDEIPVFEKAVEDWLTGAMSPRVLFKIAVKSSPGYKARCYICEKIEQKIDQLERDGPGTCTSTLSGMVFATDEEDETRRLTRKEVMDNALILIFAGSETSASAMTNAMRFLGLNKGAWTKVVDEQRAMQSKFGEEITKSDLEKECPYLDAVIKETMRMKAVSGAIPRKTLKTIVVDGKQIPKGWLIDPSFMLTHELDPVTYKDDWSHMHPKTGFVPERWFSDETRPSADYMPFGFGPRHCIGNGLAMVEMKILLAKLARRIDFDLRDPENVDWKPQLSAIATPLDGVLVDVRASTAS